MIKKREETESLLQSGRKRPALSAGASIVALTALIASMPVAAQDDELTEVDEEMIVKGLRGTLQSAQSIKYESETFVDSIVADDIANLPDRSVTETLQRIPGVTIDRFISRGDPEHFSGEGSGVAVRGLTQVRGEINGRDGFTANGGRSLSFEDVPPELLAGVDVYKNQTADMIEGGLGGTVNLRTRMPLEIDGQLIAITATSNYQNFIDETTPSYSALYSNRWDTGIGEVGALVDLAYSELKGRIDVVFNRPFFPFDNGSDGTVYVPRGADWRTERTYRERQGVYGAFQLRPSDDLEFFLTLFRSEYDFTWDEDALFVDNDPYSVVASADSIFNDNGVFTAGTLTDPANGGLNMGSDYRVSTRNSETTDTSAGVKWQATENWRLTADLQKVKATTKGFDSTVAAGVLAPFIGIENAAGRPDITTDVDYMSDVSNYHFAFTMDHMDDNEADQTAARIDAEYSFDNSSAIKSVKFGVRRAEKDYSIVDTTYNWQAVIQPWMRWWALDGMAPLPSVTDFGMEGDLHLNDFDDFFRGGVRVPGSVFAPNRDVAAGFPNSYLAIHQAAGPYYTCCFATGGVSNFTPTVVDDRHVNRQDETIESLYAMLRFGWDDYGLSGNIGVRRVETDYFTTGFVRFDVDGYPNDSGIVSNLPLINTFQAPDLSNSSRTTVSHTLPSLNLRWEMLEGVVARLGLSKAIHRPENRDLRGFTQLFINLDDGAADGSTDINDYNGSADAGNPKLKPMESDQVDLSFEWYYSDIGSTWLNLFAKDIDNFIRRQPFTETYNGFDYTVVRPANQKGAEVDGWELGLRHFFDFGFGVEASYTRIDSSISVNEVSIPLDTDGTPFNPGDLPYEGLSENAYSLTGMFENEWVSARLAYTWRDEFLVAIGPNGFNGDHNNIVWRLPVFQDDYGQWDGSVFFNLSDQYTIGLEVNNLTNEELDLIQRQIAPGSRLASSTVQDTRYALTVRAKW